MAAYNFSLNPRLPLNPSASPAVNTPTSISGLSNAVIRPPQPPPPTMTTSGHLVTMHHPLMGSARPILINPQGFPVTANPQFFGDTFFSTAALTPSVLASGLNDTPLEFNVLRPKSANEQIALIKEKFQVQNLKQMLENRDKPAVPVVPSHTEIRNIPEKNTVDESEVMKEVTEDSDGDDCLILHEKRAETERIGPQTTATTTITSQTVPVLTSNPPVWNNLIPNVNLSLHGVNQMLTSNLIDPNLVVGQTYGVFGNVLSQLSSNTQTTEQNSNAPIKTIIHCKSCTLFPPNANAPAPTTRERPLGCRTVFVGGLPENVKEDVIREVFGFCGEITNIRLSNKKFCHVRFSEESAVDQALTLSGYRIRIGSSPDPPNTGRLHVDFAHARDDQYEWECKQRQIQREQRHRERMLRENYREISPSSPSHYTESEANGVLEKLKGEDTFLKAISTAVCWLDRGECNKRNVNTFYNMIQSVNSHIRRLLNDKNQCESDFKKAKELLRSKAQSILTQFVQIEKLFTSSSHKKVWDHFTKAQRKNIELWKKSAMEIKKLPIESEEPLNDEMDVSDSDSEERASYKKRKVDISETNSLKDDNDSLRCQLEAYKNEICVIRSELQCEINRKNEQINLLQNTLNSLTQEAEKTKQHRLHDQLFDADRKMQEADTTVIPASGHLEFFSEKEARLIGLISIFLHIHPFGAGVDYICSFLQKILPSLKVTDIEFVMSRFPSVFQQEIIGIGANMERRWKYVGFNVETDISIVQS